MINFTKMLLNRGGVSSNLHKERIPLLAVWNVTNKCNLKCRHCYISANESQKDGELSTEEVKKLIDSLLRINAGVLLFSGGEPLLREDIWELAEYAQRKGIRCALSTNGTLISEGVAERLKASGVIYAGISVDGDCTTHDEFRGSRSYERAVKGLRNCKKAGLTRGVRFTLHKLNHTKLSEVLELVVKEEIPRFCLYHLVYSGRAKISMDIGRQTRKRVIDLLIQKTIDFAAKDIEILTVDDPCDGIYLYKQIVAQNPQREEDVLRELMFHHGRCSAGERIVGISPQGEVYACQFWNHRSLGNIRKRDLYDIWSSRGCPVLDSLRNREGCLKGKCGDCSYKSLCGGCRLRAKAACGDIWGEDPSCYLTKEEIIDTSLENKLIYIKKSENVLSR